MSWTLPRAAHTGGVTVWEQEGPDEDITAPPVRPLGSRITGVLVSRMSTDPQQGGSSPLAAALWLKGFSHNKPTSRDITANVQILENTQCGRRHTEGTTLGCMALNPHSLHPATWKLIQRK